MLQYEIINNFSQLCAYHYSEDRNPGERSCGIFIVTNTISFLLYIHYNNIFYYLYEDY